MTSYANSLQADLRSLEHDVLHQLSTIAMLVALLDDVGAADEERRLRVHRLGSELRWLDLLLRIERGALLHNAMPVGAPRNVRLDIAVANLVATAQLVSKVRIRVAVAPVVVSIEHVGLGRALRNLVWNSIDAAGPDGELDVRVAAEGTSAVISFEDDGPGLGEAPTLNGTNGAHLGLGVVREVASAAGGRLRLEDVGHGCRATLVLPLVTERGR
jgi:signal transduction histidine kinase